MHVIFKNSHKIGNRSFAKGKQIVPDHLFSNLGFKKLIAAGHVQVLPRDENQTKIQMSRDMKAMEKARMARKARQLAKSGGSDQALQMPSEPVIAEVEDSSLTSTSEE